MKYIPEQEYDEITQNLNLIIGTCRDTETLTICQNILNTLEELPFQEESESNKIEIEGMDKVISLLESIKDEITDIEDQTKKQFFMKKKVHW